MTNMFFLPDDDVLQKLQESSDVVVSGLPGAIEVFRQVIKAHPDILQVEEINASLQLLHSVYILSQVRMDLHWEVLHLLLHHPEFASAAAQNIVKWFSFVKDFNPTSKDLGSFDMKRLLVDLAMLMPSQALIVYQTECVRNVLSQQEIAKVLNRLIHDRITSETNEFTTVQKYIDQLTTSMSYLAYQIADIFKHCRHENASLPESYKTGCKAIAILAAKDPVFVNYKVFSNQLLSRLPETCFKGDFILTWTT